MTGTTPIAETLRRLPNGRIEAPDGYVGYSGQLVIRTRYGTIQRWKKEGWDSGRMGELPYILAPHYCREESDTLAPKNDLELNEVSVHYVEHDEKRFYRVDDSDEYRNEEDDDE